MKCHNLKCQQEAKFKIIHLGSEEIFYCESDLYKYQSVMNAMGAPQALVFPIEANYVSPCVTPPKDVVWGVSALSGLRKEEQ